MKKRFIFEVEEGKTPSCIGCPFDSYDCGMQDFIDCEEYNMHSFKLVENVEQA